MWSLSECIPWMTVGLAESVAIVTLNLCTIIAFISNRNLRKRSTYLVINLAVIDMFVGGVVGYDQFYWAGVTCNLWKWQSIEYGTFIFIEVLLVLLLIGSLTNITSIALQRLHATFFPFKHRYIIQVCELVCSSQSSKPFELAAAYLQITKGTKETNNNK